MFSLPGASSTRRWLESEEAAGSHREPVRQLRLPWTLPGASRTSATIALSELDTFVHGQDEIRSGRPKRRRHRLIWVKPVGILGRSTPIRRARFRSTWLRGGYAATTGPAHPHQTKTSSQSYPPPVARETCPFRAAAVSAHTKYADRL